MENLNNARISPPSVFLSSAALTRKRMFATDLAYTFIMNHKKDRLAKLNEFLIPKAVAIAPALVIKFSEIVLCHPKHQYGPDI